ncbi:MAG: PilZ domain-containing protein [Negativicutes bacterium]|nr:PilZ domain-containing protein [Negativicutes bacterium]
MNALKLLKPNQKLEIMIARNGFVETYKSRVEEIAATGMVLAMPMRQGYPIILSSGELFQGKFILDGTAYQFDCRYLEKKQRPLPVWLTSLPMNISKIQQRNFVRIDAVLDATLLIPEDTDARAASDNDSVQIKTITKDISGGGALVILKHPLPPGRLLSLSLTIPDAGVISAKSEVVRSEQPKSDQEVYWVALKFLDISEKQRSLIIKHIFKLQLERRKKGF